MSGRLLQLLERATQARVLVIGEAMLDSYIAGFTGRLCREAPVPIVTVRHCEDAPGAAANVASNVAALGANVVLLSAIGADGEGKRLVGALDQRDVPWDELVIDRERSTLAKQRIMGDGQLLARFDQGTCTPVSASTEAALVRRLEHWFPRVDAVVVSDYGYGILTPVVIDRLASLQARSPRVLVVDAKQLAAYHRVGITAAKPNYEEAARMLGLPPVPGTADRANAVAACAAELLGLTGARMAVVTLDTEGAVAIEHGRPPYRAYAYPVRRARTAGAGDTFGAALALGLAIGAGTPGATDFASAAAAIVVAKDGTAVCSADELRSAFSSEPKFIADLPTIEPVARAYRQRGRDIVLTNGCFDILHRGHISCLNAAKALGDVLVVAVNSDQSVRRLKGASRPVNPLEDRVEVLAALSCVDHVVAFDDDVPDEVIRRVQPRVFVKGGDYTRDQLPEAALVESLGGTVRILPYVDDRSTTGIISRIRHATQPPVVAA